MKYKLFSIEIRAHLHFHENVICIVDSYNGILRRTFIFHRVQIPIKTKLGHFNET